MQDYLVTVVQTAAYSVWDVRIRAKTPAEAVPRALTKVATGDAGDGRFEHCGSAPDDVRPPYAVGVCHVRDRGTVLAPDFPHWEIGAQFPEVTALLAAADKVVARWERGDLAEAVRELDAARKALRDAV